MDRLLRLYDWLDSRWQSAIMRRIVASVLVVFFLAGLVVIELARRGILSPRIGAGVPLSHFRAIELAFYLLLSYEVVGLVFGIARSVSNAAGKQLEIFSLILLRHSFEVFSALDEPLQWLQVKGRVLEMLSDGTGALAIFVVLGFYYRLQRHRAATSDLGDRRTFIKAKKVIAFVLLGVFAAVGGRSIVSHVLFRGGYAFFEEFYTLLIFADILIVLLSLRYSSTYHVVFRNSGLAVATVLLRLALNAPAFVNALLGLAAAVFALALTVAYNAFTGPPRDEGPPSP